MLKKLRKSSGRVTLVLIGVAALSACGNDEERRRDVYAARDDCLADWSNKPEDCTPATEARHASGGYWYGPVYPYRGTSDGSEWTRGARQGSRAIASSTSGVSRGGFGSSGHSSGS